MLLEGILKLLYLDLLYRYLDLSAEISLFCVISRYFIGICTV